MSKHNIEDDYDINLKIDQDLFKYNSLKKTSILLKGHIELPQKYKFTYPKLTNKGIYLTVIGKAINEKENDVIFIWKAKHLNAKPFLKFYGTSKIEVVQFSPEEDIFVVLYKNKPPEVFNFDKKLLECEKLEPYEKKVVCYCFSKDGKRFAVATDKDFIVYNIENGKIYLQIISDDKIKICRGKTLVLINNNYFIQVIEFLKLDKNKIKDITDGKEIFDKRHKIKKQFQLTPMAEIENIITAKLSPDKKYIFFIAKDGVYRISIESEEIDKLNKEEKIIKQGEISDSCTIFMTTDFTTVKFWDFENYQNIGYIYKEKFDSFSINFPQSKLITADNLCIDITDIMNNLSQQKFIWLDLNPKKFTSISFSPDYKVLLAIIDEHSAISYNCSNGNVIRKWKINLPNWSRACQMVPETSSIGVIATKSYNKIIKIWDYLTGTDLSTFEGFDVNNFSFSKFGNFLAAGTTEGEEIARAWNLKTGEEFSLFYNNENFEHKNKFTYVKIHSENNSNIKESVREDNIESLRIIAVSEDQNPLIFNLKEKQLIRECDGCPIQLSNIIDVQSQELYNLFYIHGKCVNGISTSILFDLNGEMISEFENCRKIEFCSVKKCLLEYSDDLKQNTMSIVHLDEHNDFNRIECRISEINSKFLSDGKCIVSIKDIDEKNKKIYFNEIKNGKIIGEIDFEKKTNNFIAIHLNLDEKSNCVIFRFIELNEPKQS